MAVAEVGIKVLGDGESSTSLRFQVVEMAVRPTREFPVLRAGYGNGDRGGSVYAKLVPAEPWEIIVEVPADKAASLDGLADVAKQLFRQMDLVLVLAEGQRTPANGNGGAEIRGR